MSVRKVSKPNVPLLMMLEIGPVDAMTRNEFNTFVGSGKNRRWKNIQELSCSRRSCLKSMDCRDILSSLIKGVTFTLGCYEDNSVLSGQTSWEF